MKNISLDVSVLYKVSTSKSTIKFAKPNITHVVARGSTKRRTHLTTEVKLSHMGKRRRIHKATPHIRERSARMVSVNTAFASNGRVFLVIRMKYTRKV